MPNTRSCAEKFSGEICKWIYRREHADRRIMIQIVQSPGKQSQEIQNQISQDIIDSMVVDWASIEYKSTETMSHVRT